MSADKIKRGLTVQVGVQQPALSEHVDYTLEALAADWQVPVRLLKGLPDSGMVELDANAFRAQYLCDFSAHRPSEEKTVGITENNARKGAEKLAAVNEYCQRAGIGKWGASATDALIDDHERLARENASLRNSLESVVDGRAAILALVRGEDVACDGWLVELEKALKERLQRNRKTAALGALEIARKQFNNEEFDKAHAMIQGCIEYVQQIGLNAYIDNDGGSNGQ